MIAAGLEPATVGSEVQRSSIEPRDRLMKLSRLSSGHHAAKVDTEGFEPSTSRMRNGRSSTELSAPDCNHHATTMRSYPSGHGAGLEIQWALPAQVRTLPIAFTNVRAAGIEPAISRVWGVRPNH